MSSIPSPACNADATTAPAPNDGVVSERFFLIYKGVNLPLQLAEELDAEALRNRNTYFRAGYDTQGRMVRCEKRVYGETEMLHTYRWAPQGHLCEAVITIGEDDPQVMTFDAP